MLERANSVPRVGDHAQPPPLAQVDVWRSSVRAGAGQRWLPLGSATSTSTSRPLPLPVISSTESDQPRQQVQERQANQPMTYQAGTQQRPIRVL